MNSKIAPESAMHRYPPGTVRTLLMMTGLLAIGVTTTAQTRTPDNSPEACQPLLEAAQQAVSGTDFRARTQHLAANTELLAACDSAFARSAAAQRLAELQRRSIDMNVQTGLAARTSVDQLALNPQVEQARAAGVSRLAVMRSELPPDTTVVGISDGSDERWPDAIASVTPTPVVPGADVVIEGLGFGEVPGIVRLDLGQVQYSAEVTEWHDHWIAVRVNENVMGIPEMPNAGLEVQRSDGHVMRRTVRFVPLYEQELVRCSGTKYGARLLSGSMHFDMFAGVALAGHWRVSEIAIGGVPAQPWDCQIDGPPSATSGSAQLQTRVRLDYPALTPGGEACLLEIIISGPRGLQHGLHLNEWGYPKTGPGPTDPRVASCQIVQ